MPKQGFKRNSKVIAGILHNDPGGQKAVDDAAQKIFNEMNDPEAILSDPYHTDRYVRGVRIPADTQAKHGTGTRAGQSQAI